jgi:hypothetical protein
MFQAAASKFPTCWQVDWLVRYVCYICSGMIYGINGTIIRYCFCCILETGRVSRLDQHIATVPLA